MSNIHDLTLMVTVTHELVPSHEKLCHKTTPKKTQNIDDWSQDRPSSTVSVRNGLSQSVTIGHSSFIPTPQQSDRDFSKSLMT